MEASESLRTLAEIAVALTGFTGIVVALGRRSHGAWKDLELLRLQMLLITSLAVLFFSLLPLLLSSLHWQEPFIWKISNVSLAAVHFIGLLSIAFKATRMDISQWTPKEKKEEIAFSLMILPISLGLIGCEFSYAFGNFAHYGFFLFFLGLIFWLILAALHFILLLIPEE